MCRSAVRGGGGVKIGLFTVYETMPDGRSLYLCKGGSSTGTSSNSLVVSFLCPDTYNSPYTRSILKAYTVDDSYIGVNRTSANGITTAILYPHNLSYGICIRTATGNGSNANVVDNKFGPSFAVGSSMDIDAGRGADGFFVNDVVYTPSPNSAFSVSSVGLRIDFCANLRKLALTSFASSGSFGELKDKSKASGFYVFQNYIRYTDQGSYVNRTVIPNIGTLGSTYNLEANNVPALWYGI